MSKKKKISIFATVTIDKYTPGALDAETEIDEYLQKVSNTLQKYLFKENNRGCDGYERNVTMSAEIDKDGVVLTYIAEAVNKETGELIFSNPKKSLYGAMVDLEVKKGTKILRKLSLV